MPLVSADIPKSLRVALDQEVDYRDGPVVVGVHVDYSDNHKLFEMVHADSFH